MVVFTCNHCGESLQKPKVEKHYVTVCRKPKFVTCVDCFKDFRSEEYVAHTKCVTEEERYAAKGSLPTEGVVKKGEVKQQSWTDLIQNVVGNMANATKGQQRVIEIMSSSPNVPRKRNKFINFIKSSTGNKVNMQDIEGVWDLIEKSKTDQKLENSLNKSDETNKNLETENENGSPDPNLPVKQKKKSKVTAENEETVISNLPETNGDLSKETKPSEDDVLANGNVKKRKSKKNKKSENIEEENISQTSNAIETNSEQNLPKKKKKKTKLAENEAETIAEVNNESLENGITKKNKKAKHSQEDVVAETNENVETVAKKKRKSQTTEVDIVENVAETNGNVETVGKKKRKSNKTEAEDIVKNESPEKVVAETNGNVETVAKKKRKSHTTEVDVVENESPEKKKIKSSENGKTSFDDSSITSNGETAAPLNDSETTGKFSFEKTVIGILKSKTNISLQKLQKKILGTEASAKTIKKFYKKLNKLNGIEISGSNVQLMDV